MMTLAEVRDYVATIGIAVDDNCYCGKLDSKKDKSIGIYNLKRNDPPITAIGGIESSSYNTKGISLLVHWTKSQRTTEQVAQLLYSALLSCRNVEIGDSKILFIKHLHNEPIDVGTDNNGIYEFVIECLFYYER